MASKDAEGMYGVASEGETVMPHLVYSEAEILELYPPLTVPEDIDQNDPQNDERDELVEAGELAAADILREASVHGRRRQG